MTLFPEWQEQHKDEVKFPLRLTEMHRLYGKLDGEKCKNCVHLARYRMGGSWMKCNLSKQTNSSATDWKAGWPACGNFEKGGE